MATSLHHPCHPHALNLQGLSRDCNVHCLLCGLDLCGLDLCGSAHCCLDCDIFVHELCADLPLELQHPSHPKHSLNLSRSCRPNASSCEGCNKHINDSFIYCCDDSMFTLNITCAVSTLPPPGGHPDVEIIQHFAHDHPLALFHMDKGHPDCVQSMRPVNLWSDLWLWSLLFLAP